MTYELIDLNGYTGVKINDGVYLIDNGMHTSVPSDLWNTIQTEERSFVSLITFTNSVKPSFNYNLSSFDFRRMLEQAYGVSLEHAWDEDYMTKTFGQVINGIIGMDILRKFHSIEVDKVNKTVTFGEIKGQYSKEIKFPQFTSFYDHGFETDIVVNGHKKTCFFDIGAHALTINDRNLVSGINSSGTYDEGIAVGAIVPFEVYKVNFTLNGDMYTQDALLVPSRMSSQYPDECFMSASCLAKESFAYDFDNCIIKYK